MATSEPRLSDHAHESTGSYELVLSAVLLGLLGLFLDRRLGTTPLLVIGFSVAGFIGAALSIYYRYRHRIAVLRAETEQLRARSTQGAGS